MDAWPCYLCTEAVKMGLGTPAGYIPGVTPDQVQLNRVGSADLDQKGMYVIRLNQKMCRICYTVPSYR